MLCPKRGGAMKPSNLFSKNEYWKNYHIQSSLKKGKKSNTKQNHSSMPESEANKSEDKNLSLNAIMQREYDF